jgi:hypothetical protein
MSEYDYSPEAIARAQETRNRVRVWSSEVGTEAGGYAASLKPIGVSSSRASSSASYRPPHPVPQVYATSIPQSSPNVVSVPTLGVINASSYSGTLKGEPHYSTSSHAGSSRVRSSAHAGLGAGTPPSTLQASSHTSSSVRSRSRSNSQFGVPPVRSDGEQLHRSVSGTPYAFSYAPSSALSRSSSNKPVVIYPSEVSHNMASTSVAAPSAQVASAPVLTHITTEYKVQQTYHYAANASSATTPSISSGTVHVPTIPQQTLVYVPRPQPTPIQTHSLPPSGPSSSASSSNLRSGIRSASSGSIVVLPTSGQPLVVVSPPGSVVCVCLPFFVYPQVVSLLFYSILPKEIHPRLLACPLEPRHRPPPLPLRWLYPLCLRPN